MVGKKEAERRENLGIVEPVISNTSSSNQEKSLFEIDFNAREQTEAPTLEMQENKVVLKFYFKQSKDRDSVNQIAAKLECPEIEHLKVSRGNIKHNGWIGGYRSRIEFALKPDTKEETFMQTVLALQHKAYDAFKCLGFSKEENPIVSNTEETITPLVDKKILETRQIKQPKFVLKGQEAVLKLYSKGKEGAYRRDDLIERIKETISEEKEVKVEAHDRFKYTLHDIYRTKIKVTLNENQTALNSSHLKRLMATRKEASACVMTTENPLLR